MLKTALSGLMASLMAMAGMFKAKEGREPRIDPRGRPNCRNVLRGNVRHNGTAWVYPSAKA